MIGKIERVKLREVWKHEAKNFTQWLQNNIDVLNDVLPIELTNPEREHSTGNLSVDLVAEDDAGHPVIVENQLERSDHDHLGKLLTYLSSIEARTAIWLTPAPRPEHINAITWLNESAGADFYLIKLEAIRIGNSPPAALLTVIVEPSEESKHVGQTKKELAERYHLRREFWTKLLNRAKTKTNLHSNITPGQYNWIGTGSGKRGIAFNYGVRKHDALIELYIDRGKETEEENNLIFDQLYKNKQKIENTFGGTLEWRRLESKRACRIIHVFKQAGYRDEGKWDKLHENMVNAMIKFEKAFRPYISKLKI